jgi:hypothetical protein
MARLRLRALTVAALLAAGTPSGAASGKSALDAANAPPHTQTSTITA